MEKVNFGAFVWNECEIEEKFTQDEKFDFKVVTNADNM